MSFKAFQSHGEFAEEVIFFTSGSLYLHFSHLADALIQSDL
jgi:hypothetical protein